MLQKPAKQGYCFLFLAHAFLLPIFWLFLFFLGSWSDLSTALAASDPVGRITKLKGNANVLRGTTSAQVLRIDDPIFYGDTFRTKARSRVGFALSNGNKFTLGANAKINLSQYTIDKKLEKAMDLLRGKLRLLITDFMKPETFQIKTSTAIIETHGADFLVYAESRKTTIMVYDGMVLVKNSDGSILKRLLLRTNETTVVYKGLAPKRMGTVPGEEDTGSGGRLYRRANGLQGADPTNLVPSAPPAIPLPNQLTSPNG